MLEKELIIQASHSCVHWDFVSSLLLNVSFKTAKQQGPYVILGGAGDYGCIISQTAGANIITV